MVARDPRWVPPHGPSLRRELRDPETHLIYVDALPQGPTFRGSSLESAVAAVIIRRDSVRKDVGCLGFLHSVNDGETLRVLLESLAEHLRPHGIRTVLGPTHLFPHLGSGALSSHWHLTPPLHTPYNPPFLDELCQSLVKRVGASRLYHLPAGVHIHGDSPATLSPFEPERLARDLLPLLQVACSANPTLSPPDADEAERMLRWLSAFPLHGWLAEVGDRPVGFALLQPDDSSTLRKRRFLRFGRARIPSGRLLFLGVLPDFRGRGVARHLASQSLEGARERGWETLSAGPLPRETGNTLEAWGAQPSQHYTLYRYSL